MNHRRVRSAPLISGTIRSCGPEPRAPLAVADVELAESAQVPLDVVKVEPARLAHPQADLGHQLRRGVVPGRRGELPAGRQLTAPACEQRPDLRLARRNSQLGVLGPARPVHLVERALRSDQHPPAAGRTPSGRTPPPTMRCCHTDASRPARATAEGRGPWPRRRPCTAQDRKTGPFPESALRVPATGGGRRASTRTSGPILYRRTARDSVQHQREPRQPVRRSCTSVGRPCGSPPAP